MSLLSTKNKLLILLGIFAFALTISIIAIYATGVLSTDTKGHVFDPNNEEDVELYDNYEFRAF